MTLLEESALRALGRSRASREKKSANQYLRESQVQRKFSYDVFLSHSSLDAEIILGLKMVLESLGLSVYIDWLDDPQLSRDCVNKKTAATIKSRMDVCGAMLYAVSSNALSSKWMPWELGYFDGLKQGQVGILPISTPPTDTDFKGYEYLALYPVFEVRQDGNELGLFTTEYVEGDPNLELGLNLTVWSGGESRTSKLYRAARNVLVDPNDRIRKMRSAYDVH